MAGHIVGPRAGPERRPTEAGDPYGGPAVGHRPPARRGRPRRQRTDRARKGRQRAHRRDVRHRAALRPDGRSGASLRDAGIETAWASQIFGYDALTALAVIGREVPGIDLGTAVVPTYPRNPVMLAGQALTVQAATGGRLTLGIGLSHQVVIENVFGQSFDKPARHMREYLSILMPLLEGEQVSSPARP